MIESWFFVLAMLAVLLIPGPTNALLASATHQQGAFKTIIFIPIEWLGYVYGISLWALFIHLFEPIWPALDVILHTVSLAWYFGWHFIFGKVRICKNMINAIRRYVRQNCLALL
jgi:threonine/homoserine/homoserine lactone efflux protein